MIVMEDHIEDILSLSLAEIVIKCPPEITAYLTGAAFTRFNQSADGDGLFESNVVINRSGSSSDQHLFGVTSDWSLAVSSSVPTPSGILRNHQELQHSGSIISARQHEDMQRLKYYSYGIALPAICILGILGNVLNLIVLTRPSMRGPAYVYMRGTYNLLFFTSSSIFIFFFTHKSDPIISSSTRRAPNLKWPI